MVQPDTVGRWKGEALPEVLACLSRPKGGVSGRPRLAAKTRRPISDMATLNPLWGAPRMHGELKTPVIDSSERTVSRIMRTVPLDGHCRLGDISQQWRRSDYRFMTRTCELTSG